MSDEKIKDAMDATQVFLNDKEERRRYINREMAFMDRRSELASAREDERNKTMLENIRHFVAGTGWSAEHEWICSKSPRRTARTILTCSRKIYPDLNMLYSS